MNSKIDFPKFTKWNTVISDKQIAGTYDLKIQNDGWYYAIAQAENVDIAGDVLISINGFPNLAQTYAVHQWTKVTTGLLYLKKDMYIRYSSSNNLTIACSCYQIL